MKRIFFLVLVLLLSCPALAEVPAEMRIVNCQEWVSLRAEPDSAAQRFAEVPLGATLRGYYQSNGDFTQCEYQGTVGYILSQYIEVVSDDQSIDSVPTAAPDQELQFAGGSVRVWNTLNDACEEMLLECVDAEGNSLWTYATQSLATTELESLSVFLNESAAQTMVMVHNSYYGLIALDAQSGESLWTLPCAEVSLGGSIHTAVAEDGTMYIGGYYGPDPAAISPEGKLLWQSSSLHEDPDWGETPFYWMDRIEITSDGIDVHYINGDTPVTARFDAQGSMLSWEKE